MDEFEKEYLDDLERQKQEFLEENMPLVIEFQKYCSGLELNLTIDNFISFYTIGTLAQKPNIVNHLKPDIIFDKEGLINLEQIPEGFKINKSFPGIIEGKNFHLLVDIFFRHGFNELNNYATSLIKKLWFLQDESIDKYIAIDKDRVKISPNDYPYNEKDMWYGVRFDQNIDHIVDCNVVLKPPSEFSQNHNMFLFSSAHSLNICWNSHEGVKSFYAYEFKSEEITVLIDNKIFYPVKYIHAEYLLKEKYFRHLDGSIHFFSEEDYYKRRDENFRFDKKNSVQIKPNSRKLFKLNGVISRDLWIEIVNNYFSGNPLIIEYFEGVLPLKIKEFQNKLKNVNI